jgi:cation/acetate symporter
MAAIFGSDSGSGNTAASNAAFRSSLNKVYTWYTGGFIGSW